jgi:hypothetical protein
MKILIWEPGTIAPAMVDPYLVPSSADFSPVRAAYQLHVKMALTRRLFRIDFPHPSS